MVKFVEIVSIFKQPFLRMSSVLMFITIALFVAAARQLCGVKSQILASLNSFLTHLQMGSGEAGLHGFPHVITAALWSVRLFLLLKYCLRQATTQVVIRLGEVRFVIRTEFKYVRLRPIP